MRRPPSVLTLLLALPFFAACVTVHPAPLPEPDARPGTRIRGLVLRGAGGDGSAERVEMEAVERVTWRDSEVVLVGLFERARDGGPAPGIIESRTYPLSQVEGVLVRSVDANRTSAIVAGTIVGAIVIGALLIEGKGPPGEGPGE